MNTFVWLQCDLKMENSHQYCRPYVLYVPGIQDGIRLSLYDCIKKGDLQNH